MFRRTVNQCSQTKLYTDTIFPQKMLTKSNTENFSDKWSKFYNSENRKEYDEFQAEWFLTLYGVSREDLIKDLAGAKILDAGCGGGDKTHSMALLNQDCDFWGVDLSSKLEVKAKETKNNNNLNFLRSDIANLPFEDQTFDIVICDRVTIPKIRMRPCWNLTGC